MSVLSLLLDNLPSGWMVENIYVGANWVLSCISYNGERRAGLASSPVESPVDFSADVLALEMAQRVLSSHPLYAAVGLATLNALLQPDESALTDMDAADWLVQNGAGRNIAIVGRFPFIADELAPVARKIWTFERDPEPGEYVESDMPHILPDAEIIAITSSTLINHTIDDVLAYVPPQSVVMLLGPSTPLSTDLFVYGIDLLSGVQVIDIPMALQSVQAGVSFRQMQGLRRVTLCNRDRVNCNG